MAHFAQIDENNIVTQVIVIANNQIVDPSGQESEELGVLFCKSLFGDSTNWKQTSYNGKIRKNYAGIGFTYKADIDAFVPPKPFNSWTLDQESANWLPPVPYPNDGLMYMWDEQSLSWKKSEKHDAENG